MRAHANTDTAVPDSEGCGPRPTAYGVPSPDLLARADRGFTRFLERIEDQDDRDDDKPDTPR